MKLIINPLENIQKYIEDEKTVPLVRINNILWYSITEAEKESLIAFLNALDSIPPSEWNELPETEKWDLSCAWNDANRILTNSVIREGKTNE